MDNEEMQRTMQFILEQQAQFSANIQVLQEAQARTESTMNALSLKVDTLAGRVDALAANHESRIRRLEESFQLLVRLAESTNALMESNAI